MESYKLGLGKGTHLSIEGKGKRYQFPVKMVYIENNI